MKHIINNIKRILPEPVKRILRQFLRTNIQSLTATNFQPYLKAKNVEGVAFDFWIMDRSARDWYDLQCADPIWIEMRFMRDYMLRKGDIVFECGGHHGCTAIVMSHWVGDTGKVITFEALPRNCDIIAENIKQNKLQNISLVRKAVGDKKGVVSINDASNSSIVIAGKGLTVEMTCLDAYASLNPSFLKIDVEGFELNVLKGAAKILAKRPKLAIEIHVETLWQYGASVEELFSLINPKEYKFWVQWEDSEQPEEYDMHIPIKKRVHLFALPVNPI